jgi:hypothetical protein
MPASRYKIWAIGQPVGDGVSGSIHVGIAAIAKKSNAVEPNIVINEQFCNLLAHALFLPCPPGALLDNSGEIYFCSLNFNLAGQALPPTPISTVIAEFPELCWGVLLFDVLVMNPDRHSRNLSYDRNTKEIQIFDHSRAFLTLKETIENRIADNTGKLGFSGHCLKTEINTMIGFDYWVKRIKSIPDYVIEESVKSICQNGFPKDKRTITVEFFKTRRNNIDSIVMNNLGEFPKLPKQQPVAAPAPLPAAAAGIAPQPKPPTQPGPGQP